MNPNGQISLIRAPKYASTGRRRRPLLAVALILAILVSLTSAITEAAAAPGSVNTPAHTANRSCDPCPVVTTDDVNLRKGPGKSYAVIKVIPANTEVLAYAGAKNGYRKVLYGQATGWVHGDYLRSPNAPQWIGLAATDGSLNLRQGPGTNYPVTTVMPGNSIVKISDQIVDGFRLIAYNGNTGWASEKYLIWGYEAVATRKLAIRAQPNAMSTYRGSVPAWETVTAFTHANNGYVLIIYGSKVGWVQGRYLS
jgi:uncharacterized protein YgiM (DUF1202 family)